jgi:hypothetical protein
MAEDALRRGANGLAARGYDVMVACDLPKVDAWVRFPLPARESGDVAKW